MQLSAIAKLRIAFIALGAMLFVPLSWLLHAVNVRVEAQRRLRHQVVAERIFDELERELTRVLDEQSARPSSQFDSWLALSPSEPYVIGHFKVERGLPRFQNTPWNAERNQRVEKALTESGALRDSQQQQRSKQPQQLAPSPPEQGTNAAPGIAQAPHPAPAPKSLSPAEVMRKLNRAGDERRNEYK